MGLFGPGSSYSHFAGGAVGAPAYEAIVSIAGQLEEELQDTPGEYFVLQAAGMLFACTASSVRGVQPVRSMAESLARAREIMGAFVDQLSTDPRTLEAQATRVYEQLRDLAARGVAPAQLVGRLNDYLHHVDNGYLRRKTPSDRQQMRTMDWRNKTISPDRDEPPKVNISYPCPGLCRLVGMASFLVVGLGVYYGGRMLLRLEPLDWIAPVWTAKHIGLVVAGILLGALAGLLGGAFALTIEVRSERLSDFLIIVWQFLAHGSMLWIVMIGIAMSMSLGKEQAQAAVLHFGAERATWHAAGTGCIVGLLSGVAFFITPGVRLSLIVYLVFSAAISLWAARWHFDTYGIEGKAWLVAGMVVPLLLLLFTLPMIQRDRGQRRLMMEQARQ